MMPKSAGTARKDAKICCLACVESARDLGLPEAAIPLSHATVLLATAPKSNSANAAYEAAVKDLGKGLGLTCPEHLAAPLFKGYLYPHAFPGHWVEQQYLPNDLVGRKYYEYGENRTEQAAKEYAEKIKGKKN